MRLDLVPGRFLARHKRFLAEVELDEAVVTAHCANPGSMKTLLEPGATAWLSRADRPSRKLPWTLTALGLSGGGRALVDTALPNRIVEEAIARGRLAALSGYARLRREVRYGDRSRVDLLLEDNTRPPCWVEIKNVTMASSAARARADFPDSVTERGRRHLEELATRSRSGDRAVLCLLVSRSDCRRCGFAAEIDPAYAAAVLAAVADGVEILAYGLRLTRTSATVGGRLPVDLPPG